MLFEHREVQSMLVGERERPPDKGGGEKNCSLLSLWGRERVEREVSLVGTDSFSAVSEKHRKREILKKDRWVQEYLSQFCSNSEKMEKL